MKNSMDLVIWVLLAGSLYYSYLKNWLYDELKTDMLVKRV